MSAKLTAPAWARDSYGGWIRVGQGRAGQFNSLGQFVTLDRQFILKPEDNPGHPDFKGRSLRDATLSLLF